MRGTPRGLPLSVAVTVASANDKAAGLRAHRTGRRERSPRLAKLWADGAYVSGPLADHAAAERGVSFEVVGQPKGPFRAGPSPVVWWSGRSRGSSGCRRLVLDFERLAETVVAFIHVALTRLLLNRLAPHS